ncbi:hypothetical protein HBN50_01110 [Halobacteriovorax sp. GB3]|uniref:hypothetical protein n=1 Tax=Halobacteriovorax sp. GB3 TaxID=2719615 RepID=UPI0023609EDD|nr:hypothetical protein [Halobacteriovorax sp. GB3]MDD0851666.1 hypothetical protein [Halobacteriovorax sp. GB3]
MRLLLCTIIFLSFSSHAGGIEGLNKLQKKQATKCLQMLHGISYEQIDRVPNGIREVYSKNKVSRILMHNFIHQIDYKKAEIVDSAILSGSLIIDGTELSLKNTVVANATLAGDVSKVDFSGACLINVSLPTRTSWWEYFKIRNQVKHSSNIEFDDNIYKWQP